MNKSEIITYISAMTLRLESTPDFSVVMDDRLPMPLRSLHIQQVPGESHTGSDYGRRHVCHLGPCELLAPWPGVVQVQPRKRRIRATKEIPAGRQVPEGSGEQIQGDAKRELSIQRIINGQDLLLPDAEVPLGDGYRRMSEDVAQQEQSLVPSAPIALLEPHPSAEGLPKGVGGEHLGGLDTVPDPDLLEHEVNRLAGHGSVLAGGDEHERVLGRAPQPLAA